MGRSHVKTAISNIFMNYADEERDNLISSSGLVHWNKHILFSLVYIYLGNLSKVNDYFRDIFEDCDFEDYKTDMPKKELMERHIGRVLNHYLADEEEYFIETADFTDRKSFKKLIKQHNLYDLIVLSDNGIMKCVREYFNDLWEKENC